jgi:phosphatidylinositol alpha-1,6-mannosyltransferase
VVKVRPDVVISLKALPNAWIPARLARHLGARVVLDLDDLDHAYYPAGWVQSFLSRMMRWAAAKADDVTVHTEAMRRLVAEIRGGTSSVYFLDQGIDVTRFLEQPSGTDLLREKLGLGEGPVLLYAGHLGPASDLGPILPSLAPIARAHPDAKLLVVGDGRDRRRLEGLARSSLPEGFVHFAGSVPHAEVPSYYALATVALNYLQAKEANRYRASIKTREALAAGIPVVASRTPDSERFAPFVRFPEGDTPAAFAQAVLSELAVPNRERAARGRAWLLRHGTYDAALAPVVEIWEGLS